MMMHAIAVPEGEKDKAEEKELVDAVMETLKKYDVSLKMNYEFYEWVKNHRVENWDC